MAGYNKGEISKARLTVISLNLATCSSLLQLYCLLSSSSSFPLPWPQGNCTSDVPILARTAHLSLLFCLMGGARIGPCRRRAADMFFLGRIGWPNRASCRLVTCVSHGLVCLGAPRGDASSSSSSHGNSGGLCGGARSGRSGSRLPVVLDRMSAPCRSVLW